MSCLRPSYISLGCSTFPNTDILLISTQMGPHSVWCNDSSTDMEALRLDFPDSFPPEAAEDDLHDTTPEVPIPCMAQLLEKEIKANEEMPMTACRCGLALFYCSAWRRLSRCMRSLQAQHIASSSSLSTTLPARLYDCRMRRRKPTFLTWDASTRCNFRPAGLALQRPSNNAMCNDCRGPRTPCMGLPVARSCSDLTSSGCIGVPCMIPSQTMSIPQAVGESAAPMGADAKGKLPVLMPVAHWHLSFTTTDSP
jgi:hypothetical protein